jgi:hypothetical protein
VSRRHDFSVRNGSAEVEMVCAVCERREWVRVAFAGVARRFDEPEDPCLADMAARQSESWRYTHDSYVCGDACNEAWWDLG